MYLEHLETWKQKHFYLYYAMLWLAFNGISFTQISGGDYHREHYFLWSLCPCKNYFYTPWLIITSQWVVLLLRTSIVMSQWIIVLSQWITLLCVYITTSQCIMALLWASFIMYYYIHLWCCCFHIKHLLNYIRH